MKRSSRLPTIPAAARLVARLTLCGALGCGSHPGAVRPPPAPAPADAQSRYVEAHTHFDNHDIAGSVRTALAALDRQHAAMILFQMPPDTFDHPGHYDAEAMLAEAAKYPGKLGVLGGGGTLNAMIMQAVATGDDSAELRAQFTARAEQLLQEGVVGFGEMTAEHFNGATPYQYAPADHPLYLLLADIAAAHGVPIDVHIEAVPEDMALPADLKSPPNPPQLHANITALERLLDHNPRAKIIWAHAGSDGTGYRTPALCRQLLGAHGNLYMEIKTDPGAHGKNYPLVDGKLAPEWLALFTEFPDRFIVGSDQHYPEPADPVQRWQEIATLMSQLPPDVRTKIGTTNVAHIYGERVAAYLTPNHGS